MDTLARFDEHDGGHDRAARASGAFGEEPMLTLRIKTLLAIVTTLIGLSGALYAVSSRALLGNAAAAEERDTRRAVRVAQNLFEQARREFCQRWTDWSEWDDAYQFVQDGNPAFVKSNLIDSFFVAARVNLAVFADASGKRRFATGFDLAKNKRVPVPPALEARLRVGDLLFGPGAAPKSERSGIVVLPEGPMLLCSQASVDSEAKGPAAGTVLWGRYLSSAEITRLTEPIGLALIARPIDDPGSPPDFLEARGALSAPSENGIVVRPIDDAMVAGYGRIDGLDGAPALLVRVENERTIFQKGMQTRRYLMVATGFVGLVFSAVTLVLLERLVLSRLARLSKEVARIGEGGDLSTRVGASGNDELALVSASINGMLTALEANEQRQRKTQEALQQAKDAAEKAQERSERLLLNVLPQSITERLKEDQSSIAEHFEQVTILFADIVGFTPLAARMNPKELVAQLNQMFSAFDHLAEKYGLEKIKTIGDAYMVVGGLPVPRDDHASAIADMALDMQRAVGQFLTDRGEPFEIRIGINTGSVVAGVIGRKKFIYDLWGDAVNVASRIEARGEPGKIHVTEAFHALVKDQYRFERRGAVLIKGKGAMTTYWLVGRAEPRREAGAALASA